LYRDHLVALHGFIKKTRKTLEEDLENARIKIALAAFRCAKRVAP
jgi:hypothetical protein